MVKPTGPNLGAPATAPSSDIVQIQANDVQVLDNQQSYSSHYAQQGVYIDLNRVDTTIPAEGVPMRAQGHCKAILPFTSEENIQDISWAPARKFGTYTAKGVTLIDGAYGAGFRQVGKVDALVNDNLDYVTGLDDQSERVQFLGRWAERAAEVWALAAAIYGIKDTVQNKTLKELAANMDIPEVDATDATEENLKRSRLQKLEAKAGFAKTQTEWAKRLGVQDLSHTRYRDLSFSKKLKLSGHRSYYSLAHDYWAPAAGVFLANSQFVANPNRILSLIDPEQSVIKDDTRYYARRASDVALWLGGSAMMADSYRKIKAPKKDLIPNGAKPVSYGKAFLFTSSVMAVSGYFDSVGAHQRTMPLEFKRQGRDYSAWDSYQPWEWSADSTLTHVMASRAGSLALFGYVWNQLPAYEDRVVRYTMRQVKLDPDQIPMTESELTAINKRSSAVQYLDQAAAKQGKLGKWSIGGLANKIHSTQAFSRSAFKSILGNKNRAAYIGTNLLVAMPLTMAVGRAIGMAQDYDSEDALTATGLRTILTDPTSASTRTYALATKSYATGVDTYALNMYLWNYSWEGCSKQREAVYQVSVKLVEDYKDVSNTERKAEIAATLVNYWAQSQGMEREKIEKLFIDRNVGFDPAEVMAYAKAN